MPADVERRHPGERGLGQQLLGPVLAEIGDPGRDGRGDAPGVDGLGRGHQRDVGRRPPGAVRRRRDPLARLGDARRDRRRVHGAHAVRTTTTAWRPVTPSRRWEK